jgi:photosystem II stability/assembly factor-like uncharacterized protein
VAGSRIYLFAHAIIGIVALAGCGEDSADPEMAGGAAAGHVHGLGVDPADDSLYIATHAGLFRAPAGETEAARVGSSEQDTMGFTVTGPGRFLGSGHPGPGEKGPPSLGLIASDDAGQSWEEVSLAGEADFHVLRYAHKRVYALNALSGKLMVSDDGGENWEERAPPPEVIDLAVDPRDPQRILASTARGLAISEDEGQSWKPAGSEIGLLAWLEPEKLYLVDARGEVSVSDDAGSSWRSMGTIGGQPAAFLATPDDELYAALPDGTIEASSDGGASWKRRASVS